MKNINITVENKRAAVVGSPMIICGNSDYTVTFAFDTEWSLTGPKTARFVYVKRGEVMHEDVLFSGNTVAVPVLSDVTFVNVGVFAGDLCTTTPARVNCHPSILCGSGIVQAPTPDVYSQIMALFEEMAEKGALGGATEEQMQLVDQNRRDIAALADGTKKAGDAEKLGGHEASHFATAQSVMDLENGTKKAGKAKEADNAKTLGGHEAEYFATAKSVLFQRVPFGTDTRNCIEEGLYFFSGLATNYVNVPSNTAHNGIMSVHYASDGSNVRVVQRWTSCNENRTYEQTALDDDWKSWKTIATTADLAKYLPLTGGTLTDNTFVKRTDNNSVMLGVENALNKLHSGVNGSGVAYMQDKNGNVIVCNTDGTRTFNGTASGNLPLDGGGAVRKGGYDALQLENTVGNNTFVTFRGTSGRNGGLGFINVDKPCYLNSTQTAFYDLLHTGNSAKVHIGTSAPSDTSALWIDTSA